MCVGSELDCCWFVFRASLKEERGRCSSRCLGGGELGHGLVALGDGVLGELARENQAHRVLDLAGHHRGLLVVARQLGGLVRDLLEDDLSSMETGIRPCAAAGAALDVVG